MKDLDGGWKISHPLGFLKKWFGVGTDWSDGLNWLTRRAGG